MDWRAALLGAGLALAAFVAAPAAFLLVTSEEVLRHAARPDALLRFPLYALLAGAWAVVGFRAGTRRLGPPLALALPLAPALVGQSLVLLLGDSGFEGHVRALVAPYAPLLLVVLAPAWLYALAPILAGALWKRLGATRGWPMPPTRAPPATDEASVLRRMG